MQTAMMVVNTLKELNIISNCISCDLWWSDWCGARESASASGNANLYAGVPRIDTCYVDRTVYV